MAGHRRDLLAGLAGQVIDIGAATGQLRPLPRRRHPGAGGRARATAARLAAATAPVAPVPVEVTAGTASALPAADASHDAAAVSFVLCTVPDQAAALTGIRRVLRPGGTLCFLEHVRAGTAALVHAQWALEVTVWPHLSGGCHLSRDTAAAIQRAAFTTTGLKEFLFPAARTPVSFHLAGTPPQPRPGRRSFLCLRGGGAPDLSAGMFTVGAR